MRVWHRSSVLVGLLVFAACLSPSPVHSQDQRQPQSSNPVAVVAVLPLAGAPDEGVRRVLASVMRLELERRGLQTIFFASTDEQNLVRDLLEGQSADSAASGLLRGLLELSGAADRDFLFLGGYTREGEEIQVEFGIADAAQGSVLGAVSIRAPIDFRLDDALIRALRELLPRADGRIAEVARRRAAEIDEAAPEQVVAASAAASIEEKGRGEEVGGMAEGSPVQTEGAAAVELEPSWSTGSRFRRLEFSIGFAPFIPLAEAGNTLGVGFVPFLYADYRIPTVAGILGIGLYSGLCLFTAEETGLASYFKYVVPVGVDLRFSGPEALRLGMFVRGGLGVGINASSFEKLPAELRDELSRVLPYVYGGIGVRLGFSEGVGLAADVLYQTYAYFWQESAGGKINAEWIMGFVPSLYVFTRL